MLSEVLTWNETNEQGVPVNDTVPHGNDDWRGAWMIPGLGASAFTGRFPPNSTGQRQDFRKANTLDSSDTIPACGTGLDKLPDFADIPCREDESTANTWASARSKHNEGVNAAMGDGSVQFIADDIDAFVWHSMCTRAGSESVGQ
jgi:prepilin-type processing-associated H-X9-DG protein